MRAGSTARYIPHSQHGSRCTSYSSCLGTIANRSRPADRRQVDQMDGTASVGSWRASASASGRHAAHTTIKSSTAHAHSSMMVRRSAGIGNPATGDAPVPAPHPRACKVRRQVASSLHASDRVWRTAACCTVPHNPPYVCGGGAQQLAAHGTTGSRIPCNTPRPTSPGPHAVGLPAAAVTSHQPLALHRNLAQLPSGVQRLPHWSC